MIPTFPASTTYNDLLSYFVETKYETNSREQTIKTIKATFKKLTGYSINAKVEDTDLQLVIDTLSNAKIPHCTFADWLCKFDEAPQDDADEGVSDSLEAASYDVMMADAAAKTELLEIVLENMVAPEAEKIEQLEAVVTKYQEALRNLEIVEQYARIWRRTILNLAEEIDTYNPISPPTVAGVYQTQPKKLAEMVRNGVTWEGLLPQISVSPYRMLVLCGDLFRSGSLSVVSISGLALLISKIDDQLVDYAADGVLHQSLKELYRELKTNSNPISLPDVSASTQEWIVRIVGAIRKGITWKTLLQKISKEPDEIISACDLAFRLGSLRLVDAESLAILLAYIEENLTDYAPEGFLHTTLKQLWHALSGDKWVTDFRAGRPH